MTWDERTAAAVRRICAICHQVFDSNDQTPSDPWVCGWCRTGR